MFQLMDNIDQLLV